MATAPADVADPPTTDGVYVVQQHCPPLVVVESSLLSSNWSTAEDSALAALLWAALSWVTPCCCVSPAGGVEKLELGSAAGAWPVDE